MNFIAFYCLLTYVTLPFSSYLQALQELKGMIVNERTNTPVEGATIMFDGKSTGTVVQRN